MGFGKKGTGVIIREEQNVALATLAARTALKIGPALVTLEDFLMLKSEIFCELTGLTTTEAHLIFGIAENDLSVTEIKECLDVNGPLDRGARVETEQAERFVKVLGALVTDIGGTDGRIIGEHGGPMIVAKPRWTFANGTGKGWVFFLFNLDSSALQTGGVARMQATHYGKWKV